ncbi:hypothetical protein ACFXAF_00510 [Kitasatospora sp. NPDC059463]|uniref:hypothetical protein n=1 Tax=unclassified Kitasatospora TaxID=2633591 RepID=UPI0036AAEF98
MTPTDTTNGWGWVRGTRGEQTRCYPAGVVPPPTTAEETVKEIARRLGLRQADPEQILGRLDHLQASHRAALRAAALARYGGRPTSA